MKALCGLAAVAGHSFPVWLNFKGGKSAATGLGVLSGVDYKIAIITVVCWAIISLFTGYVSVATIASCVIVCVGFIYLRPDPFTSHLPEALLLIVGSCFIIFRHGANVKRLIKGTEPRSIKLLR